MDEIDKTLKTFTIKAKETHYSTWTVKAATEEQALYQYNLGKGTKINSDFYDIEHLEII